MNHDLKIIPVINKIDLTHARVEEVMLEMEQVLGIKPEDVIKVSAKSGIGIDGLLRAIVERIPQPVGDQNKPLQAMVFDSHYDDYRGAITYVRLIDGTVQKGQKVRFLKAASTMEVLELGQFVPGRKACDKLTAGEVGYLICNIKSLADVHIGDTVTIPGDLAAPALAGYKQPKRMVYCGLYPSDGQDFEELRDALQRLSINDPSFEFEPERAMHSVSVSVVASWVCCTWRSCNNAWNKKPTSIWCRPRRT